MNFNQVVWFEIPVVDMARAKAFYSAVFLTELHDMPMPGIEMAVFDSKPENASGTFDHEVNGLARLAGKSGSG